MQQDQRNLILAVVISALLLFGYQFTLGRQHRIANPPPPAPTSPAAPILAQSPAAQAERADVLAEAPRIKIETPKLHGTLSLAGGRIDDLVLAK
jgi:YidC/Oxa1 family membrane protein insertase